MKKYTGIHNSIVEKILIWEVYMITLFSYVSQRYQIDPLTLATILQLRETFMGTTWWSRTDTLRAALTQAGIKRNITDTQAYVDAQACQWLARIQKGKITYVPEDERKARLRDHVDEVLAAHQEKENDLFYTAKKMQDAIEHDTAVDTRSLGKLIRAHGHLTNPRLAATNDKTMSIGWPAHVKAQDALEIMALSPADDYTKITAVRWLWEGYVFAGKPKRRLMEYVCQHKGCTFPCWESLNRTFRPSAPFILTR